MTSAPEKVLNWLYSVLTSEYVDVNRTYHDVAEVLSHYPSLSPLTRVYTFENGASALLLRLQGTLPVAFRGATYGFPIELWIPHTYPHEPPMVYIMPSQDMVVRPGQHVSGDGKVYHPYLAQWGKYWDKSTLFDFLAMLRTVFAKEPPVRAKQQQQQPAQLTPILPPKPTPTLQAAQATSSLGPVPPPKPPKPYEQNETSPMPQGRPERHPQPPPVPPHPRPQPPLPSQRYQAQQQKYPQPPDYAGQARWHEQGSASAAQHRKISFDINPIPSTPRPPRPFVQAPDPRMQRPDLESPVSPLSPEAQHPLRYQGLAPAPNAQSFPHSSSHHSQLLTQHPQHAHPQSQSTTLAYPPHQGPHQNPGYRQNPTKQPSAPPPNLMDMDPTAILSPPQSTLPAPPIPPNPEKDNLFRALSTTLTTQIRDLVSQNTAAITPLQSQQIALQQAYARLQAELGEIQQLDAVLTSNEKILNEAMVEADRVMQDARQRAVPDIDDVLVAPTIVGGQLYTVAAEERGIAEALFVLGRALDKGRIGADLFIKYNRSLAREQFLKKALVKKIAKGMGLDDYGLR